VPVDVTKAIFWLRNAADRNESRAQYNLGWAYESGTGVPRDTQEAIKWYGKAADAGIQEASVRLARLTAANSFWGTLFRHLGQSKGL
jgi:TPR repeat protein